MNLDQMVFVRPASTGGSEIAFLGGTTTIVDNPIEFMIDSWLRQITGQEPLSEEEWKDRQRKENEAFGEE